MNKYKICVYAITKNEEKFVKDWMESMSEADEIIVTDTGSTDNTAALLRELGAKVFEAKIDPWRFDEARNVSLSHVPEDADICLCTDLDERLNSGWRQLVEKHWTKDATVGRYLYNWSLKADGSPDVQFHYAKMHARSGFKWQCPVHEFVAPVTGQARREVFIPGMVLTHYPDAKKSRGSYLGLLELGVKENPLDDRMSYYLGREYKYQGEWQKCIDTLKNYLDLKSATWAEERCAAMRLIAYSYSKLNRYGDCKVWYYRAVAESAAIREPYVEFAQAAYLEKDWMTVFAMSTLALSIKEKSLNYVTMGYAWDYTPYDLAAVSAYRLEYYEIAYEYAQQALSMMPENERLKKNLEYCREKVVK